MDKLITLSLITFQDGPCLLKETLRNESCTHWLYNKTHMYMYTACALSHLWSWTCDAPWSHHFFMLYAAVLVDSPPARSLLMPAQLGSRAEHRRILRESVQREVGEGRRYPGSSGGTHGEQEFHTSVFILMGWLDESIFWGMWVDTDCDANAKRMLYESRCTVHLPCRSSFIWQKCVKPSTLNVFLPSWVIFVVFLAYVSRRQWWAWI